MRSVTGSMLCDDDARSACDEQTRFDGCTMGGDQTAYPDVLAAMWSSLEQQPTDRELLSVRTIDCTWSDLLKEYGVATTCW